MLNRRKSLSSPRRPPRPDGGRHQNPRLSIRMSTRAGSLGLICSRSFLGTAHSSWRSHSPLPTGGRNTFTVHTHLSAWDFSPWTRPSTRCCVSLPVGIPEPLRTDAGLRRAFERRIVRNSAELATGILTGEDLRYRPSRSPSVQGRLWNAVRSSVTAQMPDGTRRPAYTRFFAIELANVVHGVAGPGIRFGRSGWEVSRVVRSRPGTDKHPG